MASSLIIDSNVNSANKELTFLKTNLKNFERKDNSCYGFIDGDKSKVEEFLDNFMSITSTSFVHSECHDKAKGHKRFSDTGKI